jgi:hypothetical protein
MLSQWVCYCPLSSTCSRDSFILYSSAVRTCLQDCGTLRWFHGESPCVEAALTVEVRWRNHVLSSSIKAHGVEADTLPHGKLFSKKRIYSSAVRTCLQDCGTLRWFHGESPCVEAALTVEVRWRNHVLSSSIKAHGVEADTLPHGKLFSKKRIYSSASFTENIQSDTFTL